jgi:hypothetical protein
MMERGEQLRLTLESRDAFGILREAIGQRLDGDVAIERGVAGAAGSAGSPLAKSNRCYVHSARQTPRLPIVYRIRVTPICLELSLRGRLAAPGNFPRRHFVVISQGDAALKNTSLASRPTSARARLDIRRPPSSARFPAMVRAASSDSRSGAAATSRWWR